MPDRNTPLSFPRALAFAAITLPVSTTGLRVLAVVSAAVPVRLMKRDLLFILEKLVSVMDENRVEMLARQHGISESTCSLY